MTPKTSSKPASSCSFASIEQLDEVTHALGWFTEYRQLEPGSFSSTFTILEGNSWFLMEEQSSRCVEVQAPAPTGMFVLALVEGYPAVVNGQELSSDHILVQSLDSELRATLPAGIKVTQIGIVAERFEDVIDAVAPDLTVQHTGVTTIATAPGRLTSVRRAMRAALSAPSSREATRDEAVSRNLADIVVVAADHGQVPFGRSLHRATARWALDRAREYIEAHLSGTIRIASMCRYAGTTLRSLERIFARELGMSPQQYVTARRLNAVRRRLLAADGAQGPRVTEVALNHGFVHLGRFAGDYRCYFGESPRETLQSR
jgi:AraC family ethanolamine operon transcriptional activator